MLVEAQNVLARLKLFCAWRALVKLFAKWSVEIDTWMLIIETNVVKGLRSIIDAEKIIFNSLLSDRKRVGQVVKLWLQREDVISQALLGEQVLINLFVFKLIWWAFRFIGVWACCLIVHLLVNFLFLCWQHSFFEFILLSVSISSWRNEAISQISLGLLFEKQGMVDLIICDELTVLDHCLLEKQGVDWVVLVSAGRAVCQ